MRINHPSILTWLFLGLSVALLTNCDHGSDDNSNNPGNGNNTPAAGTWRVTQFFDQQDETSNYSGYTFEFGSNGSLTATRNGQTYSGSWSTGVDDSRNKFVIDFSGNPPSVLMELEEDWIIIQMTDTFMHFEHTSGGNGDTDVLQFTRS